MSRWLTSCHSETPSSSPVACLSSSSPVIVRMRELYARTMLRCLVASGTEPTPGARAQEAARLISLFLGDVCVVAMTSEDRRRFGPFAVDSRDDAMTETMRTAIAAADHQRASWPLAGRALISGEPVVIDR